RVHLFRGHWLDASVSGRPGPALVRTCVVAARRKVRGKRLTPAGKVGVFFASLGIVVTVVAATIAAFFAVCFSFVNEF
ncbi:MAG: hypothetical protein ACC645_13155, partial [Pirellulales bacterium]